MKTIFNILLFLSLSLFTNSIVAQSSFLAKHQQAVQGKRTSSNRQTLTIPNRINLPDHLRPSFENVPVWRLQLSVTTGSRDKANTDSEVYVQFNNSGGKYYLDKAGDDREKRRTDVYEILNPAIKTIKDIQYLKLTMNGNDGWCIQKIALIVNGAPYSIFKKTYSNCHWIDKDDKKYRSSLLISGRELRRYSTWKHFQNNKAIWLPPSLIKRSTLEKMVECYVGHLMNAEPKMRKLEFGKKYGRAYVEATKKTKNRLHFDLDLVYDTTIDLETDVDFDLVINCQNNKISLKAQSVKAKINIPILSSLIRVFKSNFAKMNMGNFNFGNANVPFCPRIAVTTAGDVSLGL